MHDELSAGRWLGLLDPDGVEVDYQGYERQPVLPRDWAVQYEDEALFTIYNVRDLRFAEGDPDVVVGGCAIWDSCSEGERLKSWEGCAEGNGFLIAVGRLAIQLDHVEAR